MADPIFVKAQTDGKVGIGTDSPKGPLHVHQGGTEEAAELAGALIVQNSAITTDFAGILMIGGATGTCQLIMGIEGDQLRGRISWNNNVGRLQIHDDTGVALLLQDGDFAIGIPTSQFPTANSGQVLVLGDNGATPPTMHASTAGLYNNGAELYGIDGGSNSTLLTSHPADAPENFYTNDRGILRDTHPPRIERTEFPLLGIIAWERSSPSMYQAETFDAYNTRHGLSNTDAGFLQVRTQAAWDAEQARQVTKSKTQRTAWESADKATRGDKPPLYVAQPIPAHTARYM